MKEQWDESILDNGIYVPGLPIIYSLAETSLIMRNNDVIMSEYLRETNLFELEIKTAIQESCDIVQSDFKVLHERLGLMNVEELRNINKAGAFPLATTDNEKSICEASHYGNHARLPFRKSEITVMFVGLLKC